MEIRWLDSGQIASHKCVYLYMCVHVHDNVYTLAHNAHTRTLARIVQLCMLAL